MASGLKKRFVISAVNIVDGGPLTILISFIEAMQSTAFHDWEFIALVHPTVSLNFGRVKKLQLGAPKKSWITRLYYEYVVFKSISQRLQPKVWLSLHDISPNVVAHDRFVYCHNPAPFYRMSMRDLWLDPSFFVFNKLYKLFYRLNINKNKAVIVQQRWLRNEFTKFAKVPIHVTHPAYVFSDHVAGRARKYDKVTFVYPAFPRVFKNHEIICEALNGLSSEERSKIRVVFTVSGKENRYAAWLLKKYQHIEALEYRGRLSYDETQKLYQEADCVLFPSKLETWGLPLTEAKHFSKFIVCADLPYAKETLGRYSNVRYISVDSPREWAEAIRDCVLSHNKIDAVAKNAWYPEPNSVGSERLLRFICGQADLKSNV